MNNDDTSRLIKAADAARYLGITKSTVYDWIARGYLPAHRFGRTIRIRLSDLEAHIESSAINQYATGKELFAQRELGMRTVPRAYSTDQLVARMRS